MNDNATLDLKAATLKARQDTVAEPLATGITGPSEKVLTIEVEQFIQNYLSKLVSPILTDRPVLPLLKSRRTESEREIVRTITENKLKTQTCHHHMKVMTVLAHIYVNLLVPNKRQTQRDLYYHLCQHVTSFPTQKDLNNIVVEIAGMFDVPRHSLGVLNSPRGLVFGNLCINYNASSVECSNSSQTIPEALLSNDVQLTSAAACIIVIEKEGIFTNLISNNFVSRVPSILVTGLGFPSMLCRVLVHKLHRDLKLPVYALCDFNPHGMEIFFTFKFGSVGLPEADSAVVPEIRLIGLLLDDVKSFGLHSALKPFAQSDISLLKRMLNRLGLTNGAWVCYEKVLLDMLEYGQKAELQSLYQRGTEFLASEYLPSKLLQHQFV